MYIGLVWTRIPVRHGPNEVAGASRESTRPGEETGLRLLPHRISGRHFW